MMGAFTVIAVLIAICATMYFVWFPPFACRHRNVRQSPLRHVADRDEPRRYSCMDCGRGLDESQINFKKALVRR